MQPGNQVRDRDVDHARRDDAKQDRHPAGNHLQRVVAEHAAHQRGAGRQHVQDKGLGFRVARIEQDDEIAHFLRNFVRHDRQRGDDAELHVLQESRRDQDAVEEVVDRITDHDQRAGTAVVVTMAVVVRYLLFIVGMAPEEQFLKHEEHQDAKEQRRKHAHRGQRLERLGQQRQESNTEQCASRTRRRATLPRNCR